MRFGDFHLKKWNFRVHPTPNFLVRDSHAKILVNLEGVLLVVREKFRKWNRRNLLRRVRSFRSQKWSVFIFAFGLKVINLFKAKTSSVWWKNLRKGGKGSHFLILRWGKGLEMKSVFDENYPETLRKSMLSGTFCLTGFLQHLVGFHFCAFHYSGARFLIILEAFWTLFEWDARTHARRTSRPSAPRPTRLELIPRRGPPPPRSNIL